MDQLSPLRAELNAITARFEQADARAKRAQVMGQKGERAAAEKERQEAEAEFYVAETQLADLLLLLLRYACRHRGEALRRYLQNLLEPDFNELGDWIAQLERRRP